MDGLHYIKVQHAPIMGYLEPVSAPIYAFIFLGERPSPWTIAGGALIVAAGCWSSCSGARPNRSCRDDRRAGEDERAVKSRSAAGYALVAGAFVDHGAHRRPRRVGDRPGERPARPALRGRRARARRRLRPPPSAGRRSRPRRVAAAPPHGRDRRHLAAAVLRRHARHRGGDRHVPAVPRASVGRGGRAVGARDAHRSHRVPGARAGARRARRHPRALAVSTTALACPGGASPPGSPPGSATPPSSSPSRT